MGFFSSWSAWRRYKRLPWSQRNIVFYSESGQDWHHFESVIQQLGNDLGRPVSYITSDPLDPGLSCKWPNFTALCIEEGWFRTLFFQVCQADVVVLTMMDLNNLDLKRSLYPVHYIYLFHGLGSTHMVDHENSFDHYDSIFCVGPHQLEQIRAREAIKALPAKHLFEHGYHRLEQLIEQAQQKNQWYREELPATVLIAPTWGDDSIFNRVGGELIDVLLAAGFKVIMRPHYHTRRLSPEVIDPLVNRHAQNPAFEFIDQMGEIDSLFRSHLLISDWSAMAIEYALALEKPVLFIDLPRRIRNPNWRELGIEPIEAAIRSQVGQILDPAKLDQAPDRIHELLAGSEQFRPAIQALRATKVYNLGSSTGVAAGEIARLADRQANARLNGPEHAS